jgi:two-component system OmpR family response regulator
LSLDPATKKVTVSGTEHTLSNREFALLRELLIRPGAVLSRAELEDRIYGWGEEVESNVIEYVIHGLRRKLGAGSIRNVRGLGWMVERPGLSAEVEP